MSEHQRETAFLRQLIAYDDTADCHKLDERLTQAQRDESCARRAVWLMVLLTVAAAVGLGYAAVLSWDYPQNLSRFATRFTVKGSGALGLASLISLLAFLGVRSGCRRNVNQRRAECRRFAAELLESRGLRPIGSSSAAPETPPLWSPLVARMSAVEQLRLDEAREKPVPWKRWGPYFSEPPWQSVSSDSGPTDDV